MIPEEINYKNKKTKANSFICFDPMERWKQMLDLADGSYFVSDFGRIMRLNLRGIFNEIKPHCFDNEHYVSIELIIKNRKNNKRVRLAKLVLKYFAGGAYQGRRIHFLDKNKFNSRLSNLRYKTGFIKDIDYKYLGSIDGYKVCDSSRIIIRYLFTEEPNKLINEIQKFEPYILKLDKIWKVDYFKDYDFIDFVLDVIEDIKKGGFKPIQNKYTDPLRVKKYIANVFGKKAYQYKKSRNMNLPIFQEYILQGLVNE